MFEQLVDIICNYVEVCVSGVSFYGRSWIYVL